MMVVVAAACCGIKYRWWGGSRFTHWLVSAMAVWLAVGGIGNRGNAIVVAGLGACGQAGGMRWLRFALVMVFVAMSTWLPVTARAPIREILCKSQHLARTYQRQTLDHLGSQKDQHQQLYRSFMAG